MAAVKDLMMAKDVRMHGVGIESTVKFLKKEPWPAGVKPSAPAAGVILCNRCSPVDCLRHIYSSSTLQTVVLMG